MHVTKTATTHQKRRLIRIAREVMELPVARWVAGPLYRNYFRRPYRHGNLYLGVFPTYEEAAKHARSLATEQLPPDYDQSAVAAMYREQIASIRSSDYPCLHWVDHALASGARRVFDLGGHVGIAYYGFKRYLAFPSDIDWCVHDLTHAMAAGQSLAQDLQEQRNIRFTPDVEDAAGADLFISSGALQYLPYRLPELLARLPRRPRHVMFNRTPLHPSKRYYTLQNLGIAICPYLVDSAPALIDDMAELGYQVVDHWQLHERTLRIPFHDDAAIDCYHGYCFEYRAAKGERHD